MIRHDIDETLIVFRTPSSQDPWFLHFWRLLNGFLASRGRLSQGSRFSEKHPRNQEKFWKFCCNRWVCFLPEYQKLTVKWPTHVHSKNFPSFSMLLGSILPFEVYQMVAAFAFGCFLRVGKLSRSLRSFADWLLDALRFDNPFEIDVSFEQQQQRELGSFY